MSNKHLRMSEAEFKALQDQSKTRKSGIISFASESALSIADATKKRFQAIGRLPKSKMNKTEAEYAELLEKRRLNGEVIAWKFHPMNVRLADNTFYEVDFLVVAKNLEVQIHETKGTYTTEVGNIKIKLCAEVLPWFRFIKCMKQPKKLGGGWEFKEY